MIREMVTAAAFIAFPATWANAEAPPETWSMSDYDAGHVYLVRNGQKQAYHGMQQPWVFNRALAWLDRKSGVEGAVICHSGQSPLPLTGKKQVSRWFAGEGAVLADADDQFTRFVGKGGSAGFDHVHLPPLQFPVEQHPIAELEVRQSTHPWQLLLVVKGRSGPPLYASLWQRGPGRLAVDVLKLYRQKGYEHHFAQLHFLLTVRTEDPGDRPSLTFRLCLRGNEAIVPSLPVIRTVARAEREGLPIYAVVLDRQAHRLGKEAVEVTANLGENTWRLSDADSGIWRAVARGLANGDYRAEIRAVWKTDPRRTVVSRLNIHVTDGEFFGFDSNLKFLAHRGQRLGPLSGSYRGQVVFRGVGTPKESLLHGQGQWEAAIADRRAPDHGYHWWESLTPVELDADYAYLARCGWSLVHLCQGWLWWERLDAGGRIAPHGAEQLAQVCLAARRQGLRVHFAVSHYPYGHKGPPYAQYLEAGYRRDDYNDLRSKFYAMFTAYLDHFATLFRDESTISSFTAAGEGDRTCGKTFVNAVHDALRERDPNHLFLCEPFNAIDKDPNSYRKTGWKPRYGAMRTYPVERPRMPPEATGVKFKLAALGDLFMGEGTFWGSLGGSRGDPAHLDETLPVYPLYQSMDASMPVEAYRQRTRLSLYTGLASLNPILLTWEQRLIEDEQVILAGICRAVDWSRPFQRPRLAIRISAAQVPWKGRPILHQYETALSRMPLEACYLWQDEPVPLGTLHTIDARQAYVAPTLASEGGTLPDGLKLHMPLRLLGGFAANYSWSEDRRTLLAYIRRASSPALPGGRSAPRLIVQNFPSGRLSVQLFDLDRKRVVREDSFAQSIGLDLPGRPDDFFLLVNGSAASAVR